MDIKKKILSILKLSAILIFLGRGILHGMFPMQQPYHILFGSDYQTLTRLFGAILILTGILTIFGKKNKIITYLTLLSTLILTFYSTCSFISNSWIIEQLIEYGIQLGIPIILTLYYFSKIDLEKILPALKILTALTFLGHGLFALELHYYPSQYLFMVNKVFFYPARPDIILNITGTIDLILAIFIFLPKRISRFALIYASVWGFTTAFARFFAYEDIFSLEMIISRGIPNFILRCPHGIIPLLVLFIQKKTDLRKSIIRN